MQFNACGKIVPLQKRIMMSRIISVLLLAILLQLSSNAYSQRITMSVKNERMVKVLKELKQQSGYQFFYNDEMLKRALPVTVELKNAELQTALETVFSNQPLTFSIVAKTVVLKEKASVSADEKIDVRGVVIDENGKPVAGVSVNVQGTTKTTITNDNGEFLLNGTDVNAILVFGSVNMKPATVKVTGNKRLTVNLQGKVDELANVSVIVNTGYQSMGKERSTGSISTITSKQIEQRYTPNLLDQIEGRVPGLVTYATGLSGSTASRNRSITIRGVSTINSSLNPLLVVDGLPIEGSIEDINPSDVESINVLRDAASASLYGARASNGVIVITTKKAKVSNKTSVEVSTDFTFYKRPDYDYLHYMSGSQQVDFESPAAAYYMSGAGGTVADPTGNIAFYTNTYNYPISGVTYMYYRNKLGLISNSQLADSLNILRKNNFVSQYKDLANENELLQQYNVALRTNGGRYQSSLVLNYKTRNKGVIDAGYNSLNFFYKGVFNVAKWMNVDFGVNTVMNNDKSQADPFATSPFNLPAYSQLVDASGKRIQYTTSDVNAYNTLANSAPYQSMKYNHLDELERNFTKTQQFNTRAYLHLNINITKDLKSESMIQYEDLRTDVNSYAEPNSYFAKREYNTFIPVGTTTSLFPAGGILSTMHTKGRNYSARQLFEYNHIFDKHNLNVIGGFEFRETFSRGNNSLYLGYNDALLTNLTFSTNLAAIRSAANAQTLSAMGFGVNMFNDYLNYFNNKFTISETQHRYSSGFASFTYLYDKKYNVFGSIRKDVADLFGADPSLKGRPFYSIGAGWNIHQENFLQGAKAINFLKLRLSYGLTGNTNTSTTKYITTTSSTNAYSLQPWLIISNPANEHLTWELTKITNLGVDFGLFDNRLNGSVDIYRKASSNLLASKSIDATAGYTSVSINDGEALNKGVEVALNYAWLKPSNKNGIGFTTSFTMGYNSNLITKVDNVYLTAFALISPSGGRAYQQDRPVNSLFSYAYAGINSSGQPEWYLADKGKTSGTITNTSDMVFSGTLDPKLTMGFTPELSYKGFRLSALFVYYGGHYMRADQPTYTTAYTQDALPSAYAALPNYLLNTWTPTNTNTLTPGIGQYYPTSQAANQYYSYQIAFADQFVQPADFVKMRNIILNYTTPAGWARKIGANAIRLRFQVNNAWTVWTKNKIGIDPEANNGWQGNYIGNGRLLPMQSSFVFGANINF